MQESFYFGDSPEALFGTLYVPSASSSIGFVLCSGFGKDAVIARTQFGTFARELAARGYNALRFDYRGYGDSDGEFVDATPSTMCDDIVRAVRELQSRTKCKTVGLVGLRLGGTLAAMVAERIDAALLMMWEPLPNPWLSMFNELRMTIAMQSTYARDILLTREKILANIRAGNPSLIGDLDFNIIHEGFPLSRCFVEETMEIDLLRRPPIPAPTLVVHVTDRAERPPPKELREFVAAQKCAFEIAPLPMVPWVDGGYWLSEAPSVFAAAFKWLEVQLAA